MTYDLTRESWIPVRWIDGETGPDAVGLRDALTEAHRIAEVAAPSPLETAAILRLLQALFVRLYVHPEGESDDSDWTKDVWFDLLEAGRLDADRIHAYFDCWNGETANPPRFDLLHPERPFYGHPAPDNPNVGKVNWLVPTWAKGNSETLFDHTLDAMCPALSLPEATRALLATQAYRLGGLAGPQRLRFEDGHLARAGFMCWLRGHNLFEALLLNTPPDPSARMPSGEHDAPAWEKPLPGDAPRAEDGYLDFLTWQSRHVALQPPPPDGPQEVTDVLIRQGHKWISDGHDPLVPLRVSKKGFYPFKPPPEAALWRYAAVWLGLKLERDTVGRPPRTFDWLANQTTRFGGLSDAEHADRPWLVDVYGLVYVAGKEKIDAFCHDRLPIFPSILRSRALQEQVQSAVDQAGRQASTLRRAVRVCTERLAPGKPEDVGRTAEGIQAEPRFWAALETGFVYRGEVESGFERWMADLVALPEGSDEAPDALPSDALREALERHLARWTRTLHRAAERAYNEATEAFVGSPRRIEAVALGRQALRPAAAYAALLAESSPLSV